MHRRRTEAAIVGRILVAFSELEYMIVNAAGKAINNKEAIQRALYRMRTTSTRIDAVDAMMAPVCSAANLTTEYRLMMAAVKWCLRVRNQYAHCNWADDQSPVRAGLFFTDLQASAEAESGFDHNWKHVSPTLLRRQEAYFVYAQDWLYYVDEELALRVGKLRSHPWPKPSEQAPPPLHNPASRHVPPWLSEDQKARHSAYAVAAESSAPTPTPAHTAMEARRQMKRAKKEAARDRARSAHSKPGRKQPQ